MKTNPANNHRTDEFELISGAFDDDPSGSKSPESQGKIESSYKTPPQTPISQSYGGAFSQPLPSLKKGFALRKPTTLDIPDPKSSGGENLSIILKKQRVAEDQSIALKSSLAQYFLDQRIVDVAEFEDQLVLVARNEPTIQSDPAGLIESILDKIFDDQEEKSKLVCIKQTKSYEHEGEVFTHSNESNSANILGYEFENPQSQTKEDVAKVLAKFGIIEDFKVEKDGDKFRVDLENQETVFLKSDNAVVWFKRFGYGGEQENHKAMVDLKLTPLVVNNPVVNNPQPPTTQPTSLATQESPTTELVPSAILVHRGNSILAGHYITYLLLKKEGETKWFCFDDNAVSEVLPSQIGLDGLPIEASSNCYFIKYSNKSKLDSTIPNVEEISSFDNFFLNHCWFNSAMVFLQSFSEFRELVVKMSKEIPESKSTSYLENLSDDDSKPPQSLLKTHHISSSFGILSSITYEQGGGSRRTEPRLI